MVRKRGVGSIRIVAALLLVAFAGVISLGSTGTARAQDGASVDIVDFAFQSSSVTIEAGATVTWTNTGSATHTVTADDGTFDSGNIGSGGTYSFTFDTPGTYTYHCDIHPQMTAEIVVTEAGGGSTAGNETSGNETGNTTSSSGNSSLPTTGVGTTASHGAPVAVLAFALALVFAASGLLATRRRSAR
ncbi:MAG TPA: cupredoxin family copper-binding protein [Thermomicrobiales bacterium]|jgi:plastocyanin